MKKFFRVLICTIICVILSSCSSPQTIVDDSLNCDKVIDSGEYYRICNANYNCITYYIYDKDGNIVLSETTDSPVKIKMVCDDVVDIIIGMGTGISTHKYYSVKRNVFSENFDYVISSSREFVAYININNAENPLRDRTVIVQDIFDSSLLYKSFNLDFSGDTYMKTIGKALLLVLSISIFIFIAGCSTEIWDIGASSRNTKETLLLTSESPNKKYKLIAYRTEPGATVDFSVKVYSVKDEKRELIYNAYHEYNAEIIWIDDTVVSINDKRLDMSKGEKYDWRD